MHWNWIFMVTVDGMMPPRWKWIKSMNTKYSRTRAKPKMILVIGAPQGYQKIKVHVIFACNHDGCHKAHLVAGGHLTPGPVESIYE